MSFTLGGKTARELGIVMLRESQRPILPGTVDKTMSIPGRHGAWDFGAELDARVFELECAFVTKNPRELQQKIMALAAHLVDSYGRPRELELRFDARPGQFFTVRYAGRLPIERVAGLGRFTLPLVAYDPFAYSVATNDEVVWGSEVITFEADYLMGHTGGQVQTVTSPQSYVVTVMGYAIRPTILVNGSGSNVAISANGKSFSLGSFSNANWIIDGENYTVTRDGQNALSEFSGDFLELLPGENTVTVSGSGLNLTVQVKFRDKYL